MSGYLLLAVGWFSVPLSSAGINLIQQRKSFYGAEVYCELHGGHLVSVHNAAENEAVHNLCERAHTDCWIGLTQGDRGFQWTDGSQFGNYTNWHTGEPHNGGGVDHCVKLRSQYHNGTWSDQNCEANNSLSQFVCSLPSSSASPAFAFSHASITHTRRTIQPSVQAPQQGDQTHKLRIDADHAHFTLHGQRVFLSGINQAWVVFAHDFGASQYQYRRQQFETAVRKLAQSGGNSMRIWVHYEGDTSPLFDSNGFVTGTDKDGTLISDLRQFVRYAAHYNILVFITLWNAAVKQSLQTFHYRIDGLIRDMSKLQSYLDHALVPLVTGLKDEPGLGGWEIINELEAQLKLDTVDSDPCFDTTILKNSEAGWSGQHYTAQELLRFINYQVDVIRRIDPLAQVTAGAWAPDSVTDQLGHRNMYRDDCLIKAGGKQMGTLTFYSMHSYDWNGQYASDQPFLHNATDYGLDKPLVVAEFSQQRGAGMSMSEQLQWLYHRGYAGGWSWRYTDDDWSVEAAGLSSISSYDFQPGGKVALHV